VKHLIFSDIHSNWEAFQSFLKKARRLKPDTYVFLGDAVGYGANPNEVVEALAALPNLVAVMGNHDKVALGLETSMLFNPVAAEALDWTKKKLNEFSLNFLKSMKRGPLRLKEGVCICHGAPFDEDYYIFTPADALEAVEFSGERICFFGHTHVPAVYEFPPEKDFVAIYHPLEEGRTHIKLKKDFLYAVNPGSIGQPRDRNPRGTFLIYDDQEEAVKFYRFSYPAEKAKRRIVKEGLPEVLGERLLEGY